MSGSQHARLPAAWQSELTDDYEWIPLRLPPDVTRVSASIRLAIEAEYRGWEVPEVLLSGDHGRIERWRHEQSRARSAG